MKKQIYSKLMFVLLLAGGSIGFSACGDDEPKVEDKFTTEYKFEADFTEDVLKTADIKAYIFSPEGRVTEEAVTKAKNSWTMKGASIPDKAGVMFVFEAKSGDFSGDSYELGYDVRTSVTCLNNGDVEDYAYKSSATTITVAAEKLGAYYPRSLVLGGEVTDEGKAGVTNGSNLDFGLNSGVSRPPFGSGGWY